MKVSMRRKIVEMNCISYENTVESGLTKGARVNVSLNVIWVQLSEVCSVAIQM